MIALLCPTRGRREQYQRMASSAYATARNPAGITILSASNGDDDYTQNLFPVDTPTVHMWNILARSVKDKILMLAADDIIFSTPGWDEEIINRYNKLEKKEHVFHLQDSRDPLGTPHPIVTREYIDAMGYFVPPIFLHWYVDTWTVEIARANGCFSHIRDFELIHDKPSDRGMADETHNHIRRMGWRERDKYVNDTCQHILDFETKRLSEALK